MNRKRVRALLLTWPLCLTVCIGAQTPATTQKDTAPPPSARFPASWYPANDDATYTTPAPERDAPYTATFVSEGRTLDQRTNQYTVATTSTLKARDSAGREHNETSMPRPDGHGGVIETRDITVSDPVSHCNFRWTQPLTDPGTPTAIVSCMPRTVHYTNPITWAGSTITAPQDRVEFGENIHSEPLGTRLFGDIPAKGMRQTKIIENPTTGQSSTMVTESWYSEELKEIISATVQTVPGEITYKLTDIHRGEPDPALFYPPAGYAIAPELMDLHR